MALSNNITGPIAIGYRAEGRANYSISMGYRAKSSHENGIAMGKNAATTKVGDFSITEQNISTTTATAGAATLPITPESFWEVTLNGLAFKIPLYMP